MYTFRHQRKNDALTLIYLWARREIKYVNISSPILSHPNTRWSLLTNYTHRCPDGFCFKIGRGENPVLFLSLTKQRQGLRHFGCVHGLDAEQIR